MRDRERAVVAEREAAPAKIAPRSRRPPAGAATGARCGRRSRARPPAAPRARAATRRAARAERTSSSVLRATVTRMRRTDHVGEMGRLAALLALLRDAELADQRPDGRDGAERLEPAAKACEVLARPARRARDVAEADDLRDVGVVVRLAEREVPHPASVGPDHVADAERQHERADRRRGEHGAGHHVDGRRPARVDVLVRVELVGQAAVGDVGDGHETARPGTSRRPGRARSIGASRSASVSGSDVVVQAVERRLPEPVRPERLLRVGARGRTASMSSSRSSVAMTPESAPADVP